MVINEAPEDEVALSLPSSCYTCWQTAQFDSLVAPSLAEKVRWAAHGDGAPQHKPLGPRERAAIADTIAERRTLVCGAVDTEPE